MKYDRVECHAKKMRIYDRKKKNANKRFRKKEEQQKWNIYQKTKRKRKTTERYEKTRE